MSNQPPVTENYFLKDLSRFYEIAETSVKARPQNYPAHDTQTSIALLQTLLAAEIVCVIRYTAISVSPLGLMNGRIGIEFQEQANDERRHVRLVAEQIKAFGGTPEFQPDNLLSPGRSPFEDKPSFSSVIDQNLQAERIVVEHYRRLIEYFSAADQATCALLRSMLQDEENHATDLIDLLYSENRDPRTLLN